MTSKSYLLDLDKQRQILEKEIIELTDYLNQDGWPGVDKPLIDKDGFPLAGLDLYAIREARQGLIIKQNDHKNLMHLIEQKMSEYFLAEKENNSITETKFNPTKFEDNDKHLVQVFEDELKDSKLKIPFAYVNSVLSNSPADKAGLEEGDGIIVFGDIDSSTINPLEKIAKLVATNENKMINLDVLRKDMSKHIILLIPQKWEGNGLLGCKLTLKNN